MSDSSKTRRPGSSWSPHINEPHAAPLTHPGQALAQAAVLYKMWSFAPTQQSDTQRRPTLMRANPANRRPLINLRRKPILFKRRPGDATANLDVDEDQANYSMPQTEYRTEKSVSTSSSFQSKQEQQHQQNSGGNPDDERRPLEVGPTRLQLALTKPKTTFSMFVPNEDLPKSQHAADVLTHFTQALLKLRDKATRSQPGLKLRPMTQELILCLLSNLRTYGTLPMTKLDAIRQYLIEAVQKHEKDAQDQHQGEPKKEEEGKKQDKKQPASNLPESVRRLNLLTPLIVLSSQRPSTSEQLQLACGRVKTLIRTALK